MSDNNNNNENQQKINIKLDPKVAEGTFSNLAMIGHNDQVFVLDFINLIQGTNEGTVKSRIIVTPAHAKRLVNALQENIAKFEAKQGAIPEQALQPVENKPKSKTINFGDIQNELN